VNKNSAPYELLCDTWNILA